MWIHQNCTWLNSAACVNRIWRDKDSMEATPLIDYSVFSRAKPWESFIHLPVCLSPLWLITSGRARAFRIIKWTSSSLPTHTDSLFEHLSVCLPAGFTELAAAKCCKLLSEWKFCGRWANKLNGPGRCQVSVFDSSVRLCLVINHKKLERHSPKGLRPRQVTRVTWVSMLGNSLESSQLFNCPRYFLSNFIFQHL